MRQILFRAAPSLTAWGLAMAVSACSTPEEEPPAAVEDSKILLEASSDSVESLALDEDGNIVAGDLDVAAAVDPEGEVAAGDADRNLVVYFDYDSTDVKPRFAESIQHAVAHLQGNPAGRLRLEGHTDERGTRAYNLALGERRAQSVRDMLLELGALAEQVDWVSYGEELPAAVGQGEDFWTQNRRVEIILEE